MDHEKYCSQLSLAYSSLTGCSYAIGLVILVILSFTKRRLNIWHNCCDGRPGLVVPVDMLSMPRHRVVYVCIFGLMSNTFLGLVTGDEPTALCGDGGSMVGQIVCKTAISPVFFVVAVCLFYAPLFVCVDLPNYPLLGHLLGLFYISLVTTINGVNFGILFEKCGGEVYDTDVLLASIFGDLPVFVFLIGLLGWFLCRTIIDIANLSGGASEQVDENYYMKYVRSLLAKNASVAVEGRKLSSVLLWIWPYEKSFKFPLRFLAVMVIAITLVFKLTYTMLLLGALFERNGKPVIEPFLENISLNFPIPPTLNFIGGTLIVAPFVSSALCLLLLLHMARTFHLHMKLMARGQFKRLTVDPRKRLWRLATSLNYFGNQIGFFVWAWLIYYVIAIVIMILGASAVNFDVLTGSLIVVPIVGLIWILVVSAAMILCCKLLFLDSVEPNAKVLSITNKNVFSWFSYFFIVYQSIIGFLVAVLRFLLSMLFGTLLLFRLDRNIMMDGFHFADMGHNSYLGFLYVEHTHNNPIVHVFVSLLISCVLGSDVLRRPSQALKLDAVQLESESLPLVSSNRPSANSESCAPVLRMGRHKKVARNRWLLAYTLFHNPSLHLLRAHQLREKQKEVLTGDADDRVASPFAS